MQQVIIIDTSILCVYLEVPGKEIVGKDDDKWDKQRVDQSLDERIKHKAQFIVPVAAIIETGNHIAQANHQRFVTANRFANLLIQMANREMLWEIFTEQEYQLIQEKKSSLSKRQREYVEYLYSSIQKQKEEGGAE